MIREIDLASFADDVGHVGGSLREALAGAHPVVQGAVLADAVSMWLAGHVVRDDPAETDAHRDRLLADLIDTARNLLPANHALLHERKART